MSKPIRSLATAAAIYAFAATTALAGDDKTQQGMAGMSEMSGMQGNPDEKT